MAISPTLSPDTHVEAVTDFATATVQSWSEKCQQFLDAQKNSVLGTDPSPEVVAGHRSALRLLLTLGRSIQGAAASPEFPDKRIANELEGRLILLEHSWRMVHERLPN